MLRGFLGGYIFHNAAFDIHHLAKLGLTIPFSRVNDTLIQSRILNNLAETHDLKNVCLRLFGINPDERDELKSGWNKRYLEAPDGVLLKYAAWDAALTYRLHDYFQELIGPHQAVYTRELEVRRLMYESESRGMNVNLDGLGETGRSMRTDLDWIDGRVFDAWGSTFNINSDQQVGRILTEDLGLPVIERTEKGQVRVDDYCLTMMQHPLADMIKQHNRIAQALSYVTAYENLQLDGRLYPNINTLQAVTSRMSSNEPNIQQVPRREDPFHIRNLFVPAPGYRLVEVDFDKQELRLAAELAGDAELLAAILAGRDVYSEMAEAGFGIRRASTPPEAWEEIRQATKIMVLAICYGSGVKTLAHTLTVETGRPYTEAHAKTFRDNFRHSYPRIADALRSSTREAEREGRVYNAFDRRLLVDPLYAYKAFNAKIQGTAADETKVALLRMEPLLVWFGARIIAPVHDSVLLMVPIESCIKPFFGRLAACMDSHKFTIPATVHIKMGASWGEMIAV